MEYTKYCRLTPFKWITQTGQVVAVFTLLVDSFLFVKHWMMNSTFSLIVKLLIILDLPLLIFIKTKYTHFNQLYSLEKLKIILNPDKEILPSVFNFIKRPLEARIWGSCWSNHIKNNIVFIKQWQLYLFIHTLSV